MGRPRSAVDALSAASLAAEAVRTTRPGGPPIPKLCELASARGAMPAEDWEFCRAMDRYKVKYGRQFPTWREVLWVLRSLGYRRPDYPDREASGGPT
jgi:hypothetical protein